LQRHPATSRNFIVAGPNPLMLLGNFFYTCNRHNTEINSNFYTTRNTDLKNIICRNKIYLPDEENYFHFTTSSANFYKSMNEKSFFEFIIYSNIENDIGIFFIWKKSFNSHKTLK